MDLTLDLKLVRRIVVLGAPVIFAMLTQTAINLADTFFVGKLPRDVATPGQSALGIAMPLYWAFGGFCSALGIGTQAIVARRHGEKDDPAAGAVLFNSAAVAVIASSAATLAGWFLLPSLFRMMHDSPEVQALGTVYARWRFVGILAMVGTFAYKAFYDGTERTWVHLVAAVVMNVFNIVLDWILVFGKFGFPALGVEGAGIASMIAAYFGLLLMVLFTLRRSDRTRYHPYRLRNLSGRQMWALTRLSVPSGLATVAVMSGFLMVLWVVGEIDAQTTAVGAAHIASNHAAATKIIMDVLSVCFIGTMGLGTAAATLVSKSLGEKNPDLAERYGWQAMKFGGYLFGLIGLLEAIFPDFALGIFTSDPAVIEVGRTSMRIMGGVEFAVALAIVASQCLMGAGNTKFVMYAEACLHFGVLIPLSYLLGIALDGGIVGVWIAAAIYCLGLAVVAMLKFRGGGWKTIRI